MKIQRLIDMGIECDQARGALSTYNWDLERATEQLFSQNTFFILGYNWKQKLSIY